MKSIRNFSLAALALAASLGAQAAGFQNGSFESGAFVDTHNIGTGPYFTGSSQTYLGNYLGDFTGDKTMALFAGDTAMTGWTISVPGAIAWMDNANPWNATAGLSTTNGSKFLDLTGWSSQWSAVQHYAGETQAFRSVLSQTFDTVAGTTYTVSFDIGFGPDSNSTATSVGGAPVTQSLVDVGINGVYQSFAGSTAGWTSGNSLTFTATGASTTLSFKTADTYSEYVGLDNVAVNAVPEPETYAMMLAGLGALGFVARRRRKLQ